MRPILATILKSFVVFQKFKICLSYFYEFYRLDKKWRVTPARKTV